MVYKTQIVTCCQQTTEKMAPWQVARLIQWVQLVQKELHTVYLY